MKTLLKILVLAASLGLAPAAASAQPNPNVVPQPVPQQQAQLPAQPAVLGPQTGSTQNPPAADAAKAAVVPLDQVKPEAGIGQPDGRWGFQTQFTSVGQEALWFHNQLLLPIITIITLFVLMLLLWVMFRYRSSANPVPSRTSHNTVIEVVWTLVPVIILVAIAVPSIKLLAHQYSPPKADLTVKVIGHQWYWSYQYPDNGDFEVVSNILSEDEDKKRGEPRLLGVDERVVVPAGKVVKLIVTSDDVVHSWGVPSFWVKMDAVPGRLNETWFKVDRPGLYYGQCYELCGARHGFMPIAVEVVPPAQFAAWVASKGGTMPGAAKPALPGAAANAQPAPVAATANSPVTNQAAASTSRGSIQ